MKSAFLPYDRWYHPIRNIHLFFLHVKWGLQRAFKGYSDMDVSDMDVWFDRVIPAMLLDFRNSLSDKECPTIFSEQFYEEHKDEIGISYEEFASCVTTSTLTKEWYDRAQAASAEKWKGIIDEMRFLFLEADEDTCSKYPLPFPDEQSPEYCKMYYENYREIEDYQKECREKAFALFSQWYGCLWLA